MIRRGLFRFEQPFLWNGAYGYEYIPFTGLYHVGAREYDPRTARWLQHDPIDVAGGHPNVYLYCGNDPLNAADPYGLWDWAKYFRDVGNVFVGYGQAIWGTLSSPFVIGQYYWENGVSWESTKQLFGGMWAGFCADWQAAWEGDAQAFGRAFGGVLITVGTAAAPFARGSSASAKAPSTAGSTARNGLRQNAAAAGITIPAEAVKILQYLRNQNWTPPRGYKGGRVFQNREGKLPACGNYREYDIHPYVKGQNRGSEHIVVDINTGRAWYTPDHYQTFIEIAK